MLGLPKGEVFLVPWSDKWEKEFLLEKEKIQNKIGSYTSNIHHIGSTAVKYLSSKPIIDIAIELNNYSDGEKCISALKAIGYSSHGTKILPERYYFTKGEPRTHQIHMYQNRNNFLLEQLKFRDYLRLNSEVRKEYEKLKLELSKLNRQDKHKYAEEKTAFIRSILEDINSF